MNEELVIPFHCDAVAQTMWAILAGQGLQVVRSFDLRSALAAHDDCPCPHHGTARCDCQFIVLLVYGEAETPVVITLHGRDNLTEIKIVQDTATIPDPHLARHLMAALPEAALTLSSVPIEVELALSNNAPVPANQNSSLSRVKVENEHACIL